MRRVHTLEFEDLPWVPGWLRDSLTRVLVVLGRVFGVPDALAPLIRRVLREQELTQIVDLGSGAGGCMPDVLAAVGSDPDFAGTQLLLTDRYPNKDAQARFASTENIRYAAQPVDATTLAEAPAGLKTMINCFHHMRPPQARAILEAAERRREPLLVYELADNTVPFWAWVLALPIGLPMVFLSALLLTPFVRPLSARQLFFTYVIPIIPALYAWDGQASAPRIYGLADLDELLEGLGGAGYHWEKGTAVTEDGRSRGIYLLGTPQPQDDGGDGSA